MGRNILIIANPVAGGGKGEGLAHALASNLEQRGSSVEVRMTRPAGGGRELAREVQPHTVDLLVVVGGDGSVNDVLNGLADPSPPIAVLPAGTANVWAREAGLPADVDRFADVVLSGRTVEAALGRANGEIFFLFVGAGLDARIVQDVDRLRRESGGRGGIGQWLLPGLRVYLGRRQADLTVEVDGRRLSGIGQVIVTRIRGYAGFLTMPDDIEISDDHLHVLAFPRRSKLTFLWLGLRAVAGRLRPGKDMIHVATAGMVEIDSSSPEPYQRDGDHAGQIPVTISLDPRRARFIVPRI